MLLFIGLLTAVTISKVESERKKGSTFASATPMRMLYSTRAQS